MIHEWSKTVTVESDGKVELHLPDWAKGQEVQIVVMEKPKRRGFGSMRGKIWMSDDFDAPLEEFEEYT